MFEVTYGEFIHPTKRNGDIPYITTTASNNGIGDTVSGEPMYPGNCLTVATDGSIGATFYQEKPFSKSNIVATLKPRESTIFNRSIAHFIASVIRRYAMMYNYGNKFSVDRVRNANILLPATPTGDPDFKYMEYYMMKIKEKCDIRLTLNI